MEQNDLNEMLLKKSQLRLFPDARFESTFKSKENFEDCFEERDYIIRLAVSEDIDTLMEIESQCWVPSIQTEKEEIAQRFIDPACINFVVEYEKKVISVIYTQRICESDIKKVKADTLRKYRTAEGDCVQLIALNMLPLYQGRGWGFELLEFVLQYFSLSTEILAVYAVTRCRDFSKSNCMNFMQYFRSIFQNGNFQDPILNFHQSHGARVLGLIAGYRPMDEENEGYGVLIKYDIKNRPWKSTKVETSSIANKQDTKDLLMGFLKQRLAVNEADMQKNLQELGLDSLDFTELLVFMNEKLGISVSMKELNEKNIEMLQALCEEDESTDQEKERLPLKKRIRSLLHQYPEMVPLSIEGEGPCTFWIHPLSGDVGIYSGLASQFDDSFQMIAIKACGFLSREKKPLQSVTEMAQYYCEIITAIEPEGPYHLAGFSFGGTIAYEMACQLQKQGKEVANLILVEAPYIDQTEPWLFETTYRNNLIMNVNFLLLSLMNMDQKPSERLMPQDTGQIFCQITEDEVLEVKEEELEQTLLRLCIQKGLRQTKEELEFKLRSMAQVHRLNLLAIQNYKAQRLLYPNQVKAWMFRTKAAHAISEHIWNPDYLERIQKEKGSFLPLLQKWQEVFPDLKTILLEGNNHFDILHSQSSILRFYESYKRIIKNQEIEQEVSSIPDTNQLPVGFPIAIVGMSGRFPDAENIREFWGNLKNGRNSIKTMPKDRGFDIEDYYDREPKTPGKTYAKWGGFLSDIDQFDPMFFKITPSDAQLMDPSERIFIQEAWKAIEDAGYNPKTLSGKKWGVFACAKGDYPITIQKELETYYLPTDSYAAARLSYLLNLEGAAMSIDTACSSTLAVIAQACNSLILGECEAAIAGGGAVYATPNILIGSSQSLLLSPDGQCYSFDQRANGTVVAEAVGAVILKPFSQAVKDGDNIYGVIRGWGMNQDGKTNGMTAPSGRAQSRLQTEVYEKFQINPQNITMLEAHGTGTKLGDAIEFQALTKSFQSFTSQKDYCALGSLKTNIGHAFFGAGIAGVIKVLLSIKHKQIPPSLNFEQASTKLELEGSPFYINTKLRDWETKSGHPRCAAINAFGATGTNVHLVIEEYPVENPQQNMHKQSAKLPVLILLSARERAVLDQYAKQLIKALESGEYTDEMLQDLAYMLQTGRESMRERLAMAAGSLQELIEILHQYISGLEGNWFYQGQYSQKSHSTSEREIEEAVQQWLEYNIPAKLLTLWVNGAEIDWNRLYADERPKHISVPTYPFAKQRYWLSPRKEAYEILKFTEEWVEKPLNTSLSRQIKTMICFLSDQKHQDLLNSLFTDTDIIFVAQGSSFLKNDSNHYSLNREDREGYQILMQNITEEHKEISVLAYLWPCEDSECITAYKYIVFLVQALKAEKIKAKSLVLGGIYKTPIEKCYMDSWIGFERSIGRTLSETKIKVVWNDGKTDEQHIIKTYFSQLSQEMKFGELSYSACYESGKRYVYQIQEIVEVGEKTLISPLKTGGTYFITGGLGKLGFLFARYLAKQFQASLILTGRAKLDSDKQKMIAELEKFGSRVLYLQTDVCDREAMKEGLDRAKKQFGAIHGILHIAGVVDQESIFQKEWGRFEKVLQPKINGTLLLEELLADTPRDFMCYFSSAAAVMGDFGACDYAIANRFQTAYARYKNGLEGQQQVFGKTIAVNWPLWREGGMKLSGEDNENYLEASGQRYLETEEGLQVFEELLIHPKSRQFIIAGQRSKISRWLYPEQEKQSRIQRSFADQSLSTQASSSQSFDNQSLKNSFHLKERGEFGEYLDQDLKALISKQYQIPTQSLDSKEPFVEYGIDSINIFEFARTLSKMLGIHVSASTLLSYATIEKLVEHLKEEYEQELSDYYEQALKVGQKQNPKNAESAVRLEKIEEIEEIKECEHINQKKEIEKAVNSDQLENPQSPEPIAIIGISGRFPQADQVEEFWTNLQEQKDCITQVPEKRWDWRTCCQDSDIDKQSLKWGGFLNDIERFDPLFFKISPKEAHIMDPCQRIFLEEAWHALEDAGYMGKRIRGKSCGVYVGIEEGDYGFLAREAGEYYSNQNAVLASRIAYELDLKGPSLAVTASCSSGLTALHQACQALRSGDCEMALAGGINLFVSPAAHIGMSKLDLLSLNGKSYVFEERAQGMVPGEAVAVVLLKPLSKAIPDQDLIYGCVKGSGINNNGTGNGMMAPNPLRQAELIQDIFERYQISPKQLQAVISHSVGTKLGDAAEIEGLKIAFQKYTKDTQYCSISSIKPMIGHTFAASGIVSLITMLLAMKNKTILGVANFERSNENIDFSKTPFVISNHNQEWKVKPDQPRMGAVSTSANSGSNAFAIIEEYIPNYEESIHREELEKQRAFTFSATDHKQLYEVMKQMYQYLKKQRDVSMTDLAYTLKTGREIMASRLTVLAKTQEELLQAVEYYLLTGEEKQSTHLVIQIHEKQAEIISANDLQGMEELLQPTEGRIISLPTYPFKKDAYWLSFLKEQDGVRKLEQDKHKKPESDQDKYFEPTEPLSTQELIQDWFLNYFSKNLYLRREEIDSNKTLQEYGVDSILSRKLIREVEEVFGYRITGRMFLTYPTIQSISSYLAEELRLKNKIFRPNTVISPLQASEIMCVKMQEGEKLLQNMQEEQAEHKQQVIDAMELFMQGIISFEDAEKRIGEFV